MIAKAQIAVDMVTRNLFERTADIGFLSTDDDIREFIIKKLRIEEKLKIHRMDQDDTTFRSLKNEYKESVINLKKRFKEYVSKYSVYFDIVLMDTNGNILVSLLDENKISKSNDEIINMVLNTNDDYVETYKYHDFTPQHKKTLVYSYKVNTKNDNGAQTIGVLSLCFKFTNEMKGIFDNIIDEKNQECIMILDSKSKVIATSDKYHIPIGAKLEVVKNELYKVISFGGRFYLSTTCTTKGYQGFMGLGWYGHIMVPLEYAFSYIEDNSIKIDDDVVRAILQHGDSFSNDLKQIPLKANEIQHNLNRAVWNGNIAQSKNITTDKRFSKILLNEVGKTGEKTKNVFSNSIINLTKTMILNDTVSIASLMVDIMDRNLYERANDCRWWALNSDFRNIMDSHTINISNQNKLTSILKYINELYTVYTNLFIYDRDGVIVSVSNETQEHLIGQKLTNEWVEKTLRINDSQKYCVSPFQKSEMYENKYTYIYNAAIKSMKNDTSIVGGIGIVFDSTVELNAMIDESLPRYVTGKIKNGVFGIFADKNKIIISSSSPLYKVGEKLDIDDKFFNISNGQSKSELITFNGNFYALGVKCSAGYREFKSNSDDYINDIYSFFFSYISSADIPIVERRQKPGTRDINIDNCENCIEIATFNIGKKYLGIYAKDIIEAVDIKEIESSIVLNDDNCFKGTIIYNNSAVSVLDVKPFIKEFSTNRYKDVLIVNYKGGSKNHYIGILVDKLNDIVNSKKDKIKPIENHLISGGSLIESIVVPENRKSTDILTLLNIEKLGDELVK